MAKRASVRLWVAFVLLAGAAQAQSSLDGTIPGSQGLLVVQCAVHEMLHLLGEKAEGCSRHICALMSPE